MGVSIAHVGVASTHVGVSNTHVGVSNKNTSVSNTHAGVFKTQVVRLQGYLVHKKPPAHRTLQWGYAQDPMVVLGRGAVSYERGTPVTQANTVQTMTENTFVGVSSTHVVCPTLIRACPTLMQKCPTLMRCV